MINVGSNTLLKAYKLTWTMDICIYSLKELRDKRISFATWLISFTNVGVQLGIQNFKTHKQKK